jgi:hypothetical protein
MPGFGDDVRIRSGYFLWRQMPGFAGMPGCPDPFGVKLMTDLKSNI